MKILIPGFYLLMFVGMGLGVKHFNNNFFDIIDKASAIIVVVMFFVAFFLGFIVEIISGLFEFFLYWVGCSRPSRSILNDTALKRFRVVDLKKLKRKLDLNGDVNNNEAGLCLRKAKQAIDMGKYQEFYYQSIMGRNLFISHILAYFIVKDLPIPCLLQYGRFAVTFLLCWHWYKMNFVYVRSIFVEYIK